MSGPLQGLKVVELSGLGPAPHAAMMLADMGADVVRVLGPTPPTGGYAVETHVQRGRTTVRANLKDPGELASVRQLIDEADVLLEGYRPGATERLGLGPEQFEVSNPRLIYARMTGWGQSGPMAQRAGHDINYIALTGALHAMGPAAKPVPPMNLVGDFGGGSMFVVTGILAALWERERSGKGQIIDAAMVDGVSALSQIILELRSVGMWQDVREANILDGAAPFYRTYACAGGGHIAVGGIEPQFYAAMLTGLDLAPSDLPDRDDPAQWAALGTIFADVFATRSRDEWADIFAQTDACVTPVLTYAEAVDHPHMVSRGTLTGSGRHIAAAPAPRFSRTDSTHPGPNRTRAADFAAITDSWRTP